MDYRQLGRAGTRVSMLCLGMMNFRLDNIDEGVRCIRTALDAGVNFIDTANIYSHGESEQVVGRAIEGQRDTLIVATKVHGAMADDVNARGNSRRHIKAQCEASLRRLKTDYIDLYQLHRPDSSTPIEETLQALDDLVRDGKVHYVGLSNFSAWEVMEALAYADSVHLASAPMSEQPPYNILDRRVETDLVPLAAKYGLGILPWSPLASGMLTGKYAGGRVDAGTRLASSDIFATHPDYQRALAAAENVVDVARRAGLTPVQLAVAWLCQQPGVTAPIIGPRDHIQLGEYMAAVDVTLDAGVLRAIDAIVPPREAIFRFV